MMLKEIADETALAIVEDVRKTIRTDCEAIPGWGALAQRVQDIIHGDNLMARLSY